MASGAVGVAAVSNAMTTEAPPGATVEASRTEGEAAVEEATTEEVSGLTQLSPLLVPQPWAKLWERTSRGQTPRPLGDAPTTLLSPRTTPEALTVIFVNLPFI